MAVQRPTAHATIKASPADQAIGVALRNDNFMTTDQRRFSTARSGDNKQGHNRLGCVCDELGQRSIDLLHIDDVI